MANRKFHNAERIDRNNKGINKREHILQRRSSKAGDSGYTSFSGKESVHGCHVVAFTTLYSGCMKFTYIKDRIFSMKIHEMSMKDGMYDI